MKKSISSYSKENLTHIGFPLGGIGAGMFCLEGTGSLGKFSIRNEANVFCEPNIYSALCIKKDGGNIARVIEGQVPYYKIFGGRGDWHAGAGNGLSGKNYGLPRFRDNNFSSRFPFATLDFEDASIPLKVSLTGYSPFTPTDPDNSSLPAASLEYNFSNPTSESIDAVYYISSVNFMNVKTHIGAVEIKDQVHVYRKGNGFVLNQPALENEPHIQGDFYVSIDDKNAKVNTDWFQGGWFDVMTMQWNDIKAGNQKDGHQPDNLSPGGSISVNFTLAPNESKKIVVKFAWFVPETKIRIGAEAESDAQESCCGPDCDCGEPQSRTYKPFYTSIFSNVEEVMAYFNKKYDELYATSKKFSDAIYNMTLPDAVIDAITANLSIIKSPTVLRQPDGKLWAWEGCFDFGGCCHGTCTHVWNYAQAICHLFPSLERSLRQTEYTESQNAQGHQQFRASLPIRDTNEHGWHAACDGQLGGIMKMYREWKIYGDEKWLRSYYNKMRDSIEYCIKTWDKKEEGVLMEPHHNTYDIEFWGADGMCTSFYLGALKAFAEMSEALSKDASRYLDLYKKGREYMESKLYNGEYFIQIAEWLNLEAKFDISNEKSPQVAALLEKEGPKYQYKNGCISDGVLGAWLAKMCGLGEILDAEKVKSHLLAIYKYNYRKTLITHDNPQRPGYAVGDEGGLLLCSWPHNDKPSLPFVYSDEVWTGIEYQVAAHLISFGYHKEGLDIVETCRDRYDGTKRNPFNEYECGHWYARAMASYSLIQAFSGVRYDADKKVLYVASGLEDGFKSFLCTETGYGTVIYKDGNVVIDVAHGDIKVNEVVFE